MELASSYNVEGRKRGRCQERMKGGEAALDMTVSYESTMFPNADVVDDARSTTNCQLRLGRLFIRSAVVCLPVLSLTVEECA